MHRCNKVLYLASFTYTFTVFGHCGGYPMQSCSNDPGEGLRSFNLAFISILALPLTDLYIELYSS